MPSSEPPFIRKTLVKCLPVCLGFGRAEDLRNRTRSRWPAQAHCDQEVLARRAAGRSGGRFRDDERWRRSSNSRAFRSRRLVGRFCQARAPNAHHTGSLRGPRTLAASDRSNRRHEIRPDIPAFPMVLREAGLPGEIVHLREETAPMRSQSLPGEASRRRAEQQFKTTKKVNSETK